MGAEQSSALATYLQPLKDDKKSNREKIVASLESFAIMGNSANEQSQIVAEFLFGPQAATRATAARTLYQMAPVDTNTVLLILASTYLRPVNTDELRLLAHQVAGGDKESEVLISWLGKSKKKKPSQSDLDNSPQTLEILMNSWRFTEPYEGMRDDLALAITEVINEGTWTKDDVPNLNKVRNGFKTSGYTEQLDKVSAKIDEVNK